MKTIQWYPGHMAKTSREIKAHLKNIDVVFELLDARAPLASRNPMMHEITKGKPRLIILMKADLAPHKVLTQWVTYFHDEFTRAITVDAKGGRGIENIVEKATDLMRDKRERAQARGLKNRPIRAMILGIPNVGKSTLINRLVKRKATKVGDVPGVTKHLQTVRIHEELSLLDTPGVLWPKFEDPEVGKKLALLGAIRDPILALDDVAVYGIAWLLEHKHDALNAHYDISVAPSASIIDVFDAIGKRRGFLVAGGAIDYDRVIERFIHDFRHHKFGPIMLDVIP